jgi:signal transduction histidine kinase
MVRGDAALIGDLIRNLAENALAVSPAGTEVCVAVGADGRLDAIDHGPGIAAEHRERVFEDAVGSIASVKAPISLRRRSR